MVIIKSWKDLEFEIGFMEKNNHSSKTHLSVGQILNCLSTEIEYSMSYVDLESQSFLKNWFSKYRLKKFEKESSWSPKWNFPEIPRQHEETDESDSLLRLKTAITAFRLHSGPFSHHPLFGKLEKLNWETIHLKVATYLIACIEMENREKLKKFNPNHKKQKYYSKNKNKKPKGTKSR
jgi:hypothetical protein